MTALLHRFPPLFGFILLAAVITPSAEAQALRDLIAEYEADVRTFDSLWTESPTRTSLGDASIDRILAFADFSASYLSRLDGLDMAGASLVESHQRHPGVLPAQDRITADIFRRQLENALMEVYHRGHLLPINGWWDYHATFAELPIRTRFESAKDVEGYLEKLRDWPAYNRAFIDRLRAGMDQGWVRPRIVFEAYLPTISAHLSSSPDSSRFFIPVAGYPEDAPSAMVAALGLEGVEALREQVRQVVRDSVLPGYYDLVRFLTQEYIPAAAPTPGIGALEGGMAYYEWLIRYYTTLDLTADQVHEIGLREVASIRAEMMDIVREQGYGEDFDGYVEHLRTSPDYYAATPEELLEKTALVLKRMDGELPRLFKTLPRLPYGIRPIPDYLAPQTATAYYSAGSEQEGRAGHYAVNTYDLPSRPLYEVESLSFHEAVPGHHLQIALHQELQRQHEAEWPSVRRRASFTAYTEGWALYSERLGAEVGFYQTPESRFGRLSYDMWRALRLVVDTGLHTKGWTREQAVEMMAANSALSLRNIRNEVDRYIFWPGQALAYKLGEIHIRALRSQAEEALGDRFDLRDFHEVILGSGNIPLAMLDPLVEEWISARLAEADGAAGTEAAAEVKAEAVAAPFGGRP
jgi:uncharacterized protein (DUF885 family)